MAYLGRRGALAPLTSADIPVGIVEGTDVAFLENASGTQNLTGTYSTERMYLNDSYTLTGDVTVTGHLALGSIADHDIVITQDSTERTITGSGTLEAGELLSSKQTDLTGMTGELGSVVNLDSATFPAGHVIQVVQSISTTASTTTSSTAVPMGDPTAITPIATSSKVLVTITGPIRLGHNNGGMVYIFRDGSELIQFSRHSIYQNHSTGTYEQGQVLSVSYLDSPATTSPVTYQIGLSSWGGTTYWLPNSASGDNAVTILQEIKG